MTYCDLQVLLEDRGVTVSPAEIQGTLCGLVCSRGRAGLHVLAALVGSEVTDLLAPLPEATADALVGLDFDLTLLLPDEDTSVSQRFAALIYWCQGFVVGFFYDRPPSDAWAENESGEALQDLIQIAGADPDEEADPEGDAERDLAELMEYVRAAAHLVYEEQAPREGTDPAAEPS